MSNIFSVLGITRFTNKSNGLMAVVRMEWLNPGEFGYVINWYNLDGCYCFKTQSHIKNETRALNLIYRTLGTKNPEILNK